MHSRVRALRSSHPMSPLDWFDLIGREECPSPKTKRAREREREREIQGKCTTNMHTTTDLKAQSLFSVLFYFVKEKYPTRQAAWFY
jgi:hypothetical protein